MDEYLEERRKYPRLVCSNGAYLSFKHFIDGMLLIDATLVCNCGDHTGFGELTFGFDKIRCGGCRKEYEVTETVTLVEKIK